MAVYGSGPASSQADVHVCRKIYEPNTTEFASCLRMLNVTKRQSVAPGNVTATDPGEDVHRTMKMLSLVLYPIASLICIAGNFLVIFVVLKIRRMRQSYTNFFLFNMAIADMAVGVLCIIPTFFDFYKPEWLWRLGPVVCKLNYFTQLVSYTASVLILLLITIERYLAIIFPMRIRKMKSKAGYILTVSSVWILSFTFAVPNFLEYSSVASINFLSALDRPSANLSRSNAVEHRCLRLYRVDMIAYHLATFLILYVVPLGVMSTLYGKIALVLWRSTRQLRMEVRQEASSVQFCKSEPSPLMTAPTTVQATPVDANGTCGHRLEGPVGPKDSHRYRRLLRMAKTDTGGNGAGNGGGRGRCYDYESSEGIGLSPNLCATNATSEDAGSMPKPSGRCSPSQSNAAIAARRYACRIQRSNKTLRARKRVIAMLVTVVVTFMLCKLPRHIWLFILHHGSDNVVDSASPAFKYIYPTFAYVAMYLNSALNPIIYFTFSESFRRSMLAAIYVRCSSCQRRKRAGPRGPHGPNRSLAAAAMTPSTRP